MSADLPELVPDPNWVTPAVAAAGQAVRSREEIGRGWGRIRSALKRKHSRLAVTGLSGSGKSVLVDHVTGRGFKARYRPSDRPSRAVERSVLRPRGQKLGYAVIPGQDSVNRTNGTEELFLGKKPVSGVLHVVSFGYTADREKLTREMMAEASFDLAELRAKRLQEELLDLKETTKTIRASWTRHREPIWLIVVVNKMDLFSDEAELASAAARYTPGNDSEFAAVLADLEPVIGTDNFEWEAIPACSWPETFRWNSEVVESKLDMTQRIESLRRLTDVAAARCEGARND